jgi:putative ubiquitin-RnfH superfamily antitoxin RatB of RatAB toxin-antitoxin module
MAESREPVIEVELIYALPQAQIVQTLRVPAGATVAQAIEQSGILLRCPEITAQALPVGIFGKRVETKHVLREFDRIEIYRPLIADPKQARRARARRATKSMR